MEVTRARYIYRKRQVFLIQFTTTVADLTTEEQDFRLRGFWPQLLELAAEKHIALSMYRQGLFHRKANKNEALAAREIETVDKLRAGIVAQGLKV